MVDFNKMLEEARRVKAECIFVGYCKLCDTLSKLYEENIVRLDNSNEDHDLFRCSRCSVHQERHEMIPF